jgi:uncharacterized membrane protein YedE/YeeE
MQVENFTPVRSRLGGGMIGGTGVMVLALNGKVAGISGVVARMFSRTRGDTLWRVVFLLGMIGGGAATFASWAPAAEFDQHMGLGALLIAGFLVGFGTRVGGGCTSGHGIYGLARGSFRSLVAVTVFIAAAVVMTYVSRHVLGLGVGVEVAS